MIKEADFPEFLEEIIGLRFQDRLSEANRQDEIVKIHRQTLAFMESADKAVYAALCEYEEMKNQYSGTMINFMYREGLKDSIRVLRLILKLMLISKI